MLLAPLFTFSHMIYLLIIWEAEFKHFDDAVTDLKALESLFCHWLVVCDWGKLSQSNLDFPIAESCSLMEKYGLLSHFQPIFYFDNLLKCQKAGSFLMFSGGIEVEHWLKMG